MWILGFAVGGCEWAVEIASSAEFDLRGKMLDYNRRRGLYSCDKEIENLERELAEVKCRRRELTKDRP